MRAISSLFLLAFFAPLSDAAVVALSNASGDIVNCKVTLGAQEPIAVQLAVGESKPITCGRVVEVSFEAADGTKRLKLEPYMAYCFVPKMVAKKKIGIDLLAIGLAGKSPGDKDVPLAVPQVKPLKIPITLLVDDTDRRTKAYWTAALKKRLAEASDIMERQAGVRFEMAGADEWTVDEKVTDLRSALTDFEKQVKPERGAIAIGFMSYPLPGAMGRQADGKPSEMPFAISRGMFAQHILIREGEPRTEPERVEVLVQQLGRYLGAISSKDQFSAMRPRLGDGKAVLARFKIGFDPLNVLAVNLVANELRHPPIKKLADWPAETQVRLARVYATINAALPDEPLSDEIAALLDRASLKAAPVEVAPRNEANAVEVPKPKAKSGRSLSPENDAIRKVVKAIVVKAEENAKKPVNARIKGDELTELYIRAAADTAYTLEQEQRKKAFLIALGIALDDSTLVRNNPLFKPTWTAVESDDERKFRIAVLGNPTVRFRRDLCQHFSVSLAITAMYGTATAETMGLGKEVSDMESPNGSGFDFSDLCGDFAGVEFGKLVLGDGEKLNVIRQKFTVANYVPKLDDLAEGLPKAKFKALYGGYEDKRFTDAVDNVKKRVKGLNAYQRKKEN